MVHIVKRMRKLRALLGIRLGPGAAELPPDVKRIHLDFATKFNDGHLGPRKFWRHYLPRLKYHNPAVSMTINRTHNQSGSATMTIFFADSSKDGSPPTAATSTTTSGLPSDHIPFDRTETVEMKHRHESQILSELVKLTKARKIEATAEEKEQLKQVQEDRRQSEKSSQRAAVINAQRKQKEEMLRQARAAAEAQDV
ncbi:50S ribosomal protein-like protein Mrp49 [Xylona heveae TC161]|uniref:50S ribosomal protein-like protein Mrp49 n=1 Tax=Xylona heveae (strain CBS 132557 / TC161) TaxID=1328760 RepID=A0A165A5G9_XYLHT|nr:50S ribosomal protein-like protein Mrp49 [Xylona heveae TC161]KZF19978.1 50S ribosomal protein-like protein Mrp49 [Xylona heveae TC161]